MWLTDETDSCEKVVGAATLHRVRVRSDGTLVQVDDSQYCGEPAPVIDVESN